MKVLIAGSSWPIGRHGTSSPPVTIAVDHNNGASTRLSTCQAAAVRLLVMLLGGGTMHFLSPNWFDSIIRRQLPRSPRL
jgi:hypothetical protein